MNIDATTDVRGLREGKERGKGKSQRTTERGGNGKKETRKREKGKGKRERGKGKREKCRNGKWKKRMGRKGAGKEKGERKYPRTNTQSPINFFLQKKDAGQTPRTLSIGKNQASVGNRFSVLNVYPSLLVESVAGQVATRNFGPLTLTGVNFGPSGFLTHSTAVNDRFDTFKCGGTNDCCRVFVKNIICI